MADRRRLLIWGGLGLLGFAGLVWLEGTAKPAGTAPPAPGTKPPPGTNPPPGPSPLISCRKTGHAAIIRNTRFHNWGDLRPLPLRATDPHNWATGGSTAELGWAVGHMVTWTEAKKVSGVWWVRVNGGAWALPAADLGVANPCA